MGLHIGKDREAAVAHYTAYFGQLVGATITGFEMAAEQGDEVFGDLWPTFYATLKDGTEVKMELSQDEEGNAPGFLFGLDLPKPAGT